MNNVYTIIIAAILPPFLLIWLIWWKDKYQREPFGQLAKGFFYGVVSAGIAVGLETAIQVLSLAPSNPTNFFEAMWQAFVGAAIPEEAAKLLMLWLLLRKNRFFNERFDGIVYAACVGMGFAGTENIIYLLSNIETWQSVAIGRAIFAVPGHFMFAVTMGYFYSMVYFGDMNWQKASRVFWVPVLLHGIYDGLLFWSNIGGMWSGIILMAFYVFCYKMMRYGQKRIAEHLKRDKEDPAQIAYAIENNVNNQNTTI